MFGEKSLYKESMHALMMKGTRQQQQKKMKVTTQSSYKWGGIIWLVISNCITFQMTLMYISTRDLTTTTTTTTTTTPPPYGDMPAVVASHHSRNNASSSVIAATTNDGKDSTQPNSVSNTNNILTTTTMGVVDDPVRELFDWLHPNRLKTIAQMHKQDYANAQPYPHMVLDGLFPNSILQVVSQEIPERNIKRDGCMKSNSYCAKSKTDFLKSSIQYEKRMKYYTRTMFAALKSSAFTTFLEELTGIQGILPDPHFEGSGIHVTSAGGHLNIHADFNWYKKLKLDRRVNVLLFLNPDWDESYGGHLELWSKDMKSCMQRVLPTIGRLVVFSSTDFSYHGHPQNLTAPPGRARRSLALYFYSNGRPKEECIDHVCSESSHGTLFQEPVGCNVCEETTCNVYQEYLDVPITDVAQSIPVIKRQ